MKIHELFESSKAADLQNAVGVVIEYWRTNAFAPNFDEAIKTLIDNLPSCVYRGTMMRAMEITDRRPLTSTMQLTSQLHDYTLRVDREMFGWSHHTSPTELYKSLTKFAGSNAVKEAMFYVEQSGLGLDCIKLAEYILTVFDLPADQWKTLKRNMHIIHEEREILAPFYNNVHVVGVGFRDKFFNVEHLSDGFALINNMRN